jgi:hypothetical protein
MDDIAILTRMSAHQYTTAIDDHVVSSENIHLKDYLNACRVYRKFALSSVIIEKKHIATVPSPTLIGRQVETSQTIVGYSPINSRYLVEITDNRISPWDLVDALDASRAFITDSTDRDIIPVLVSSKCFCGRTCRLSGQELS